MSFLGAKTNRQIRLHSGPETLHVRLRGALGARRLWLMSPLLARAGALRLIWVALPIACFAALPSAHAGAPTEVPEPPVAASDAAIPPRPEIHVEADRLWATFREAPIEEAIRAIGAKAPFSAVFDQGVSGSVSGRFDGEPLLDALVRLLNGASWVARFGHDGRIIALHVLAMNGAEPGRAALAGAGVADETSDDPPRESQPMSETRRSGLEAIATLSGEPAELVSGSLATTLETHEDPVVRWNAAAALAGARDEYSADLLASALVDPTEAPDVRRLAAWALGRRQERNAIWALRAALRDSDEGVRQAAQTALDVISNKGIPEDPKPAGRRTAP